MNASNDSLRCDDDTMAGILGAANADAAQGVAAIDSALEDWPEDPRLHFLKGSLLIGLKRFIGAHQALRRTVELDPGFDLARFQLGFFELTSGEAGSAIATWSPLKTLPETSWLRNFVDGLEHLAGDRFEECISCLRTGIDRNRENLPLNADMELIISKCTELRTGGLPQDGESEGAVSAASLLLGRSGRDHGPQGGDR